MQIIDVVFKGGTEGEELTALESLGLGRGMEMRCRMDAVTFSDVMLAFKEEKEYITDKEPDTFILEAEIDARNVKLTPYDGHPSEGGVAVPEHAGSIGDGTVTFKNAFPTIIYTDSNDVYGVFVKLGRRWISMQLGPQDSDPAETAGWIEFCQALNARNTKIEDSLRDSGLPVSYPPRVATNALFATEASGGPVTNNNSVTPRQQKPDCTPIPLKIAQQTSQMMRTINTAFGDAPKLHRWEIVEGKTALRHIVPQWPMQTVLSAGQTLSWWGRADSIGDLQDELKQLGIEAVFLANVLTGLCLQEGQVTIRMEELIRAVGRGEEARRSAAERARVEREIWRAVLIFDAIAIVGAPLGRYKSHDTKEVIDVALSGVEAVVKITGVVPSQTSSDGSAPPAFFSYVCGPWIQKMKGNRQVMTDFGDVMRLARIPAGKTSGAWAKSIGLNLNQRWREWAHEAQILHAGDENRLTARFAKSFTRRDLLLGEDMYRANPDAQDMLSSDDPSRAKHYWNQAIRILREKDGPNLIGYYQEIGSAPTARKGWQEAWLDQALDIRPNRESLTAVAELSRANTRARRTRSKVKTVN